MISCQSFRHISLLADPAKWTLAGIANHKLLDEFDLGCAMSLAKCPSSSLKASSSGSLTLLQASFWY